MAQDVDCAEAGAFDFVLDEFTMRLGELQFVRPFIRRFLWRLVLGVGIEHPVEMLFLRGLDPARYPAMDHGAGETFGSDAALASQQL